MQKLRQKAHDTLRRSESFFKTDMVYLAKGGFWLTLGQIISTLSAFALSIAFANLLSPDEYGVYRYILSTMALLTIPAMGGIDTALIQAIAKGFNGSINIARKTKFKYGLIGSLFSLFLSGYYLINGNSDLGLSFLIGAIFLPYMESLSLFSAILQGKKDFRKSSTYLSISQIIAVSTTLLFLLFTKELPLLVFTYFVTWTATRYISLKIVLKTTNLSGQEDASLISYGKHLTFMNILPTVASYIDRFIIFHFIGAAELAVYSIAIAPPEHIKGILKNIQILALPKFSERGLEDLKQTFRGKIIIMTAITAIPVALYILLAPIIFQIIFPQYLSAILYSQIFSISLITIGASIATTAMQSQKDQIGLYQFNIWTSVIQILLMITGALSAGVMGVIIARVLTRFFVLILSIKLFQSTKPSLT